MEGDGEKEERTRCCIIDANSFHICCLLLSWSWRSIRMGSKVTADEFRETQSEENGGVGDSFVALNLKINQISVLFSLDFD